MHTPKTLPRLALIFLVLFTACQPVRTRKDTARALAAELGATDANKMVEFEHCDMDGCKYFIYFMIPTNLTDDMVGKAFIKAQAGNYYRGGGGGVLGLDHPPFLNAVQEVAPSGFTIHKATNSTPSQVSTAHTWASYELSTTYTYKTHVDIYHIPLESDTYLWLGKPITQNIVTVYVNR